MSTLMLTARQRSLPDLLFLLQRKGFGAGAATVPLTLVGAAEGTANGLPAEEYDAPVVGVAVILKRLEVWTPNP
jgi:hypothetical protein